MAQSSLFKGGLGHIVGRTGPAVEPEPNIYTVTIEQYSTENIIYTMVHTILKFENT